MQASQEANLLVGQALNPRICRMGMQRHLGLFEPLMQGLGINSELYDPETNTWRFTQRMNLARHFFTAALLPAGEVLAIGGRTLINNDSIPTATTELYDPTTERWSLVASMQYPRQNPRGQNAQVLANRTVLVVGGDNLGTSETYFPTANVWSSPLSLGYSHYEGATALLSDGRVLVAGGTDFSSNLSNTVAEIYTSS